MNKKVSEIVLDSITKPVTELGYEIVDVIYEKKPTGMNLTVTIDSKAGITLDDCEKVHHLIDPILDEVDPTNGASYILNVSSPGLDRPIKTDADLARNIDEVVECNVFVKVEKLKTLVGRLVSFNAESITLDCSGKEINILRSNISKLTKFIEI